MDKFLEKRPHNDLLYPVVKNLMIKKNEQLVNIETSGNSRRQCRGDKKEGVCPNFCSHLNFVHFILMNCTFDN